MESKRIVTVHITIPNHPLNGVRKALRGAQPVYDPDTEGGVLVVAPGLECEIRAVFQNWSDVAGFDMLYVYCPSTRQVTYVTPADLGLPPL